MTGTGPPADPVEAAAAAWGDKTLLAGPAGAAACGDAADLLAAVPDASAALVAVDPPYHATRKQNILGDTDFSADDDYLRWVGQLADEWRRILKPSGTLYLFCHPLLAGRLEAVLADRFLPVSSIVWAKPEDPGSDGWMRKTSSGSLRRWYQRSERILMFEQGRPGDRPGERATPLAAALREAREKAGLTAAAVAAAAGGERLPDYEHLARPMDLSDGDCGDVWDFPVVRPYPGRHPAEKPVAMMERIVAASSRPGDVVVDCFSGSGATGVAAARLGRRAVLVDKHPDWAARSASRLAFAASGARPVMSVAAEPPGGGATASSNSCPSRRAS